MATITKQRNRPAYTISGNSPEIRELVEGASQTYKAGCICFPSASGRMIGKTSSSSTISTGNPSKGDFGRGIMAMAIKDAGNYTNSTTKVPFYIINDDTVFLGNVVQRLVAAQASLSYAMIGSLAGGSFTNSGMFVNLKMVAATNSLVAIRGLFEDDSVGDLNGRCYYQYIRAVRALR